MAKIYDDISRTMANTPLESRKKFIAVVLPDTGEGYLSTPLLQVEKGGL